MLIYKCWRPLLLSRPSITSLQLFNAGNSVQRRKNRLKRLRKEKLSTATFNKAEELKKLMDIQSKEAGSGKSTKIYEPIEAFEEIEKQYKSKIDESIDMCLKLGIDATKSDQQVRTIVLMPSGTGREVRVAIYTSQDNKLIAESAGADMIVNLDLIREITADNLPFDKLISTHDVIKNLKPFGKSIGPLGLMPNVKSGTLVNGDELAETVKNLKAGRIEVKNDSFSIVHACLGKRRFTKEALLTNMKAIIQSVHKVKPEKTKGDYFVWCKISRSRGPSLSVNVESLI